MHGLPIPFDIRDRLFRRHKLASQRAKYGSLGVPALSSLPVEYTASGSVSDNDQGNSEFCTCYATVGIAERLDTAAYSREYHAKCESEFLKYNMATTGCDLRTAFSVATARGFLPQSLAPFSWKTVGAQYAANPSNWPVGIDSKAQPNEMNYTWITGPYDPFNSIRANLVDLAPQGTIAVALPWFQEWEDYLYAEGSDKILPMPTKPNITFHDSVIYAYKVINGQTVLVDESWQGSAIGDVYFTQEVFNYAFNFSGTGAGTLEKINPNDISDLLMKALTIVQMLIQLLS